VSALLERGLDASFYILKVLLPLCVERSLSDFATHRRREAGFLDRECLMVVLEHAVENPGTRDILLTTTISISGLNDAACILATPGAGRPLVGRHAGSLLTGWLGVGQVGLA
jgi:hypothetical protein